MADPTDTPVTTPEPLTVAIPGLLVFQLPPGVISVNAVEAPTHTPVAPTIAAGLGLTVTTAVARQPVGNI